MHDLSHRTEEILELARIGLRVRLQRDAVFLRVWESIHKRQNWGLYPHLIECIIGEICISSNTRGELVIGPPDYEKAPS